MRPSKKTKKTTRARSRFYDIRYLGDEPLFLDNMPDDESRETTKAHAFNWYNYFYENRDLRKDVLDYAKRNMNGDYAKIKGYKDNDLSPTAAKYIRMASRGWILNEQEQEFVERSLLCAKGEDQGSDVKESKKGKPSPSVLLQELDTIEDGWIDGEWDNEYSIYNRQMALKEPVNHLRLVDQWVEGRLLEYTDHKGDYRGQDVSTRIEFLRRCVLELKRLATAKNARRKRKPKVRTADKIVAGVKYLKESTEYKLVSVDPERIVGAKRVWLFNVKNRHLEYYEGSLSVRGTTLTGWSKSKRTTLRRPSEFLDLVLTQTPLQVEKLWGQLSTKTYEGLKGRISRNHIILRVG